MLLHKALPNCVKVARQTLTLFVRVRILLRQPSENRWNRWFRRFFLSFFELFWKHFSMVSHRLSVVSPVSPRSLPSSGKKKTSVGNASNTGHFILLFENGYTEAARRRLRMFWLSGRRSILLHLSGFPLVNTIGVWSLRNLPPQITTIIVLLF